MKNRDMSVGVCSAVMGVMFGIVTFSSAHGSFSLAGSAIPLAMRYDESMHGAAYQYIKRHVSDVPFFDIKKDDDEADSTGSGSAVVPTVCDTVKAVVGDIKDVVTDTIPQDLRYRKFLSPILRELTAVTKEYCDTGTKKPARKVRVDNNCEKYTERARFTTCERYEDAGMVYP